VTAPAEAIPFASYVSNIVFSGGKSVDLSRADLVLLVGPNNAGKSAALRAIFDWLVNSPSGVQRGTKTVVRGIKVAKEGTPESVVQYFRDSGVRSTQANGQETFRFGQGFIDATDCGALLIHDNSMSSFGDVLVSMIGASERLSMINHESIDFGREPIVTPLQRLHQSVALRHGLGQWFKLAFGTEIAMDLTGGKAIPLYVGEGAALRGNESPLDDGYRDRLIALPRIEQQGDGMRSFVGLLLHVVLGWQKVSLVDEPEAFLHPPQARLLGRLLAEERPPASQILLATHSSDILRGALEGKTGSLRVLRITRQGDVNHVAELTPEDISDVWQDPVLRYSNVLDGIFHERVVVCESEGDCRFYAALADALRSDPNHTYLRDVMFVAAGGKGGMPKLVKALVKLGVSVLVAVDFDILQTTGQLRALVESFGRDWSQCTDDHRTVKAAIDSLGVMTPLTVKQGLQDAAAKVDVERPDVPKPILKLIRDLTKPSVGWERAKSAGLALLPKGADRAAGDRLLQALADQCISVVPVGEIEAFVPAESADKNEWVVAVLTRNAASLATSAELEAARTFARTLISK
jgi:hypothetical protein